MVVALWTGIAFLSGSLPLAVWLGRLALGVDIRAYGDGNPGAANVFRAGGRGWGALAMLLEALKGALPVWGAQLIGGLSGWDLTPVALAPIAGHAFSPFLGGRGGKALAVSFGVWTALTLYVVPLALGLALAVWLLLLRVEAWAVLAGMLTLLVFLLLTGASGPLLAVWAGNIVILVWKHRADFRRPRKRDADERG